MIRSDGETEAAAQDKRSIIEGTAREIDALVLLSEVLNYDFASKPIDEPFTDAELTELVGAYCRTLLASAFPADAMKVPSRP